MQRFITAILASGITVASASAGTITAGQTLIGSGTNGVNGLTASYIGTGTGGQWSEKNYDGRLFSGATGPLGTPSTGSNGTSPSTFTDSTNGITFAAINDGSGGGGVNNFWDSCVAPTPCGVLPAAIVVPIGINDPSSVWTMLNNVWGTPNGQQTTVTFDFKNGATTVTPLVINLINAYNNGATGGQIAASVDCAGPSSNTCLNFAGSDGSALAPSTTINGVNVLTGSVYSFAYNSVTGTNAFSGSNGQLYLDDQGFVFGTATDSLGGLYSQDYLVDVKISEGTGTSGVSQTALSAVTVVTPEPSTILLVLAGFGVIGASRLRRRAS